jgi:hypothetical protein
MIAPMEHPCSTHRISALHDDSCRFFFAGPVDNDGPLATLHEKVAKVSLKLAQSRILRFLHFIVGCRHVLFASNAELAQKTADQYMEDHRLDHKAQNLPNAQKGRFWETVNQRSIFKLLSVRQVVEALKSNCGKMYDALREWATDDFRLVLFYPINHSKLAPPCSADGSMKICTHAPTMLENTKKNQGVMHVE